MLTKLSPLIDRLILPMFRHDYRYSWQIFGKVKKDGGVHNCNTWMRNYSKLLHARDTIKWQLYEP